MVEALQASGGPVGEQLRRKVQHEKREAGKAPRGAFPLPLLPSRLPRRGRARGRAKQRQGLAPLANAVFALLNSLVVGPGASPCTKSPSAAQLRVHLQVQRGLHAFLRGTPEACGEEKIHDFLRSAQAYGLEAVVLPLGSRCSVPSSAATVSVYHALRDKQPEVARQVLKPSALLLPPQERPEVLPRGFVRLAESYPDLVDAAVAGGLQELRPAGRIMKVHGSPLTAGAFAVPKDPEEDRMITAANPLNALCNPKLVPRPRFAYIPRLRTVRVSNPRVRLTISKRDARHYFHALAPGRSWRKWMAHPPLQPRGGGPRLYPLHRACPMGFCASAGWAQAVSEEAAAAAELPTECRLRMDDPAPPAFPIWGSILDDFWAIEEVEPGSASTVGPGWLRRTDAAWAALGIESHKKKAHDGILGGEV